jgi:predicted nucleic acid-binding protein
VRFVLDASVTLSWLLRDTAARDEDYPSAVLNAMRDTSTTASVPMTWGLEVANVIARSEAKDLVTAAQSGSFIALLEGIPIDVDAETFTYVLSDTLQLSRRFRLSSYDASYLELALRNGAPLATLDDDLRRAAAKAGVKIFKPA